MLWIPPGRTPRPWKHGAGGGVDEQLCAPDIVGIAADTAKTAAAKQAHLTAHA
jgi:hypothetical protein